VTCDLVIYCECVAVIEAVADEDRDLVRERLEVVLNTR
jgi:hypothetical protein